VVKEVVVYIDVLGAIIEFGVFGDCNGRLIVDMKWDRESEQLL
jgi:hypothetical protein